MDVAWIWRCGGCGVGSCSSNYTLAWELPYAADAALKRRKKKYPAPIRMAPVKERERRREGGRKKGKRERERKKRKEKKNRTTTRFSNSTSRHILKRTESGEVKRYSDTRVHSSTFTRATRWRQTQRPSEMDEQISTVWSSHTTRTFCFLFMAAPAALDVPGLGVKSEPHLPGYAEPHLQPKQRRI